MSNDVQQQLLAAIRGHPTPDDAYTTEDLVQLTGRAHNWVRRAVRLLITAGTWEPVQVRRLSVLDNKMYSRPGFRPKRAPAKRARR